MSRYTYAGDFVNPTTDWRIASTPDESRPEGAAYFIECRREEEREIDGVTGTFICWTAHTSGHVFDSAEDADDYITGINEAFEEDYDAYLEENHDSIVQMERYEAYRNEY